MSATPRQILAELARLEPTVLRAYLAEVRRLTSNAPVAEIERLISSGDVAGIATALRMDASALSELLESIRTVYITGGVFEASSIRPPKGAGIARLRFDVRNIRAEEWLRDHSSRLVTRVIDDQRDAIRVTVSNGAQIGRAPRSTALDIVGRISPQTGRRAGGIVGLTSNQAGYVANARAQLLDPEQMAGYFDRQLRDRRFDGIVRRAMEAGKPVKAADIDRIVGRYSDRLLRQRGEMIARTETLSAFNAGSDQVYTQAVEAGQIRADAVTATWVATRDGRTRDSHAAMSGQTVAYGEPFRTPSGYLMRYPGDSGLGAPAAEVIQCRCVARRRVDFLAQNLG
ncbi:phage minor head protein [Panacagrimonas sp.]|uniref:phage minor head protein n=1 Tax=Panacagrimonas sp. TaxID=2480088 RepID=UPI003B526F71